MAPGYFFQFVLKNSSVGLFLLLDFCCFHFLCVSDSGRRTRLHGCLCSGFYAVMKFLFMNKLFSFECGLACLICVLTGWFPSSSVCCSSLWRMMMTMMMSLPSSSSSSRSVWQVSVKLHHCRNVHFHKAALRVLIVSSGEWKEAETLTRSPGRRSHCFKRSSRCNTFSYCVFFAFFKVYSSSSNKLEIREETEHPTKDPASSWISPKKYRWLW